MYIFKHTLLGDSWIEKKKAKEGRKEEEKKRQKKEGRRSSKIYPPKRPKN